MSLSEMEVYLQPFFDQEGLKNARITIEGSSEKGDGYLGDITFLNVVGQKDNSEKTYNFVIKTSKKDPKIRNAMPIKEAFLNEINVYNKIFPEMKKFQEEKNIKDMFNNYPKCYYTFVQDDVEGLVLHNMKSINYSLHDRHHPMSKEVIRDVLKAYAKFHALSFAIRDQKPELYEEMVASMVNVIEKFKKPSDGGKSRIDDVIETAKKQNKHELVEKLKKTTERSFENLKKFNNYSVILHGDCWNNNFTFKYFDKEETKLEHSCILDLQMSRVGSLVIDLSYFLFTCAEPSDLLENFDEMLNCYYNTFSKFLTQLGSDPKKLFPFESYLSEWKKYSFWALFMLSTILKACLNDKDEVKDLSDLKDNENVFDAFKYSIKNVEQFEKRILPPAELLAKLGYI